MKDLFMPEKTDKEHVLDEMDRLKTVIDEGMATVSQRKRYEALKRKVNKKPKPLFIAFEN